MTQFFIYSEKDEINEIDLLECNFCVFNGFVIKNKNDYLGKVKPLEYIEDDEKIQITFKKER
jgi:hypothetical protein